MTMTTNLQAKPATTLPARADVPVEHTWDLTLIYKTEADWEADFARAAEMVPLVAAFKGKLRRSGKQLLAALKLKEELGVILGKLSVFGHLHGDTDTGNTHYQALNGRLRQLGTKYGAATAWFTPELLSIKPATLERYMAKVPGLDHYRFYFAELVREAAHVRSAEVEQVLALSGQTAGAASSIFGMFNNADLKFDPIVDADGVTRELTHGNYSTFLENPDRSVREAAFRSVFGAYSKWRNTMAAMYTAQVKQDVFTARVRNHASARARALGDINVPELVYDNLVNTVNANLDKLHRFMAVRKKMLGVDKLQFWDLYVPLLGDYDFKVTYEEAQKIILETVSVFGDEYVQVLKGGFENRWVDIYENQGKRSGAYSSGTYGTVPYMLMNWQDNIGSLFTLIHEGGHSMHSWFSRTKQPYTYCFYTLFTAETASTVNEALLAHHLLKQAKNKTERKYILNEYLDRFRATLFRQTQFAEFEKIAHEKEEAGEPLTLKVLCDITRELNEKYYGAVVEIDPLITMEWARIPHFYRAFYVYQYATGISAATTLAAQILEEGEPAVKRYLEFLSSGGSDYSINLLAKAGVDLSTPAPIQKALDVFGRYVEELEQLCDEE